MFQSLGQGASVSVFYRNYPPRIVTGRVVASNTHAPAYNPNHPMAVFNGFVTDLTVQIGNETIPFAGLPANGVSANFPDKGIFLSEESAAAFKELGNAVLALEQDLSTVPEKTKLLEGYKSIQSESDPEAQRDKEVAAMRGELSEMKKMLSDLLGSKLKEE